MFSLLYGDCLIDSSLQMNIKCGNCDVGLGPLQYNLTLDERNFPLCPTCWDFQLPGADSYFTLIYGKLICVSNGSSSGKRNRDASKSPAASRRIQPKRACKKPKEDNIINSTILDQLQNEAKQDERVVKKSMDDEGAVDAAVAKQSVVNNERSDEAVADKDVVNEAFITHSRVANEPMDIVDPISPETEANYSSDSHSEYMPISPSYRGARTPSYLPISPSYYNLDSPDFNPTSPQYCGPGAANYVSRTPSYSPEPRRPMSPFIL
jgi:hypothetical protein